MKNFGMMSEMIVLVGKVQVQVGKNDNALSCNLKILSYTLPSPKVATSDGLFANQSNGAREPA